MFKNSDIAKAGLVSEDAVRKAISRGTLIADDIESILSFVLIGRLKHRGLNGVARGLAPRTEETLMEEKGYVPMTEHEFGA